MKKVTTVTIGAENMGISAPGMFQAQQDVHYTLEV